MAEEEEGQQETPEGGAGRPSPGPVRYLLLIVTVLILETVGAYFFLDWAVPEPEAVVEEEEPAELEEEGFVPPLFYSDLSEMVFSPLESGGQHLVRTTIVLEVDRRPALEELSIQHALVWDQTIRQLEAMPVEALREPSKQRVKDAIRETVNADLRNGEVVGVYFTEFIMQ